MICPSCKCEYIAGVTQCSDCGVPLVDEIDPSAAAAPEGVGIIPIWSGNDPREFAAVKEALEKAQVPFMGPIPTGYFIFPSMRPKMEIGVSVADRERAEKILQELQGPDEPDELAADELNRLAVQESDGADLDEVGSALSDVPDDWYDMERVSEVWNGNDEDLADTLAVCFRENGIPSHKLAENSSWRLVVPPGQEARAKEIVREVVDAVPPE
jgi:hypothetical protein